jgi:hypothetical protein
MDDQYAEQYLFFNWCPISSCHCSETHTTTSDTSALAFGWFLNYSSSSNEVLSSILILCVIVHQHVADLRCVTMNSVRPVDVILWVRFRDFVNCQIMCIYIRFHPLVFRSTCFCPVSFSSLIHLCLTPLVPHISTHCFTSLCSLVSELSLLAAHAAPQVFLKMHHCSCWKLHQNTIFSISKAILSLCERIFETHLLPLQPIKGCSFSLTGADCWLL